MASFFGGIPTNKEIRALIIQSADRYTAPTAQYGYGIPDFSLALTLSVKDLDKNYFVVYPNQLLIIFRFGFPKVLIKERLFFIPF
jgi:hypothetical protein